ncbi:hypothetical protein G6F68_014747 [Rhizopus microsporus]|nr:hypothetical protein G6F68_014747 [Rhizopus microsporus]
MLGLPVRKVMLQVAAGRNLAVLVEAAPWRSCKAANERASPRGTVSLYETLAAEIAKSIRDRVLRVGDKLPSVRDACTARGVSPSTVFQAYYLLEAQGLIRAQPRSGYYVPAPAESLPPEPGASCPGGDSTELAISERIFDILGSVRNRDP